MTTKIIILEVFQLRVLLHLAQSLTLKENSHVRF